MKKLLLTITVLFFVLGLSACDMFNTQTVDQISEQYCRDNPDSEICQGDTVGDLQEDAIINVYNTILDEYQDTTNTTFCEDYFSVTNVDLLDECRASRTGLFPTDVSDYTIESVTKKTTLSTIDLYEVVVVSPNLLTKYTFAIGLTKVEGIMYINSWSFTEQQIDPTTIPITIEQAQAHFEKFLIDYTNPLITSTTICDTYFFQDTDKTECINDRTNDLAVHLSATLTTFVLDNDHYLATIELTDDNGTTSQTLTLTFAYDTTGTLLMTFGDNDNQQQTDYTYDDYLQFTTRLFNDFFNSNRSPEEICNEYFTEDQYQFCMDGYSTKEEYNYTQTIKTLEAFDDYYRLTITQTQQSQEPIDILINVWFVVNDNQLYIIMDPVDDVPDLYQTYYDFIVNLFSDYMNSSLTDSICDTYFENTSAEECKKDRSESLSTLTSIEVLKLIQNEDGQWVVSLRFNNGANTYEEDTFLHFYKNQAGDLKIMIDNSSSTDPQPIEFIQQFVDQFQDSTLSSNDICDFFFTSDDAQGCINERDNKYDFAYTIIIEDMYPIKENVYHVVLYYTNGTDDYRQTLHIVFTIDEIGTPSIAIIQQTETVEFEDAQAYLDQLILDFNNTSISDFDIASMYIHPHSQDMFVIFRNEHIGAGERITYYWLNLEYGQYSIGFEFDHKDDFFFNVHFYYIDGELVAEYTPQEISNDVEFDDVWNHASGIVSNIQAGTNIDDLCAQFFNSQSYNRCEQEISYLYSNSVSIYLNQAIEMNGYWQLDFTSTTLDNTQESIFWDVFAFFDVDGNITFEFTRLDTISDTDKQHFLEIFLVEINSDGYASAEAFCSVFSTIDNTSVCIELYNELRTYNQTINMYWYDFNNNPNMLQFNIFDNVTEEFLHYLRIDAQFSLDETTKELRITLSNKQAFMMMSESEAIQAIQAMFHDLNDPSQTTENFCNQYGPIFQDCYGLRSMIIDNNGSILALDIIGDGETQYNVLASLYDSSYELVNSYMFYFEVYQELNGSIVLHGTQESIQSYMFSLDQITSRFTSYISDYFNPIYGDQDIMDRYNDGMYAPGIEYRYGLLDQGYTVTVLQVTRHNNEFGYEQYEAEVTIENNGVTETIYLQFDAFWLMNSTIGFSIIYPWDTPSSDMIDALALQYTIDMADHTLSTEQFCALYADPYDQDRCINIRTQLINSGYTVVVAAVDTTNDRASFVVHFLDSDSEIILSLDYEVFSNFDVLGFRHYTIYLSGNIEEQNAVYQFMDNLVSQLSMQKLSITDFCLTYDCNGIWPQNVRDIAYVSYTYIDYDFDDIFTPSLRTELHIIYTDDSEETVKLLLTSSLNEQQEYTFMIKVVGMEAPIPSDALLLDSTNTELILNQFIIDILDSSITAEQLCTLYFGGNMREEGCIEGREEIITQNPTITISPLQQQQDDNGVYYYDFTITIDDGDDSEIDDLSVRVYSITEHSYYIEFLENTTPKEPQKRTKEPTNYVVGSFVRT